MNQYNDEGNVVKRARERIVKGDIDGEYVLLLAQEVERSRKTIGKLQAENAVFHSEFIDPQIDAPTFDEAACADFIFGKLVERGIAVNAEDIRLIMELEYEYGVSIGIYPPEQEDAK